MGLLTSFWDRQTRLGAAAAFPGLPPRDPAAAAYFGAGDTVAGVPVNEWTALNYSAVWRAVGLISGTEGALPLPLYQRQGKKDKRLATQHPAFDVLMHNSEGEMGSMSQRETQQSHVLTWGNGYSLIERNGAGEPAALYPLTPNRVRPDRDKAGRLVYRITNDQAPERTERAENILHITGLAYDGLVGYSPVTVHRQAISLGLAEEINAAACFGNGAEPGGFFEHPAKLPGPVKQGIIEEWERSHRGPFNRRRMAVIDGGLKWVANSMSNEDAEFLASRVFQIIEIARIFNVWPHLLFDQENSGYNSIEMLGMEFVTYTLLYWMRKWEQEVSRKLLTRDERKEFFAEHDTDMLLRGDKEARYRAHAIARQWGWESANDVLSAENQNAIGPKGDVYLVPSNMESAETFLLPPEEQPVPTGKGVSAPPPGQIPAKPGQMGQAAVLAWNPDQPREPNGEFGEGDEDPHEAKLDREKSDLTERHAKEQDGLDARQKAEQDAHDETYTPMAERHDREQKDQEARHQAERDANEEKGVEMGDRHDAEESDLDEKHDKENGERSDRHDAEFKDHNDRDASEEEWAGMDKRHTQEDREADHRQEGEKKDLAKKQRGEEVEHKKDERSTKSRQRQEVKDLEKKHAGEEAEHEAKGDQLQERHDREQAEMGDRHSAEEEAQEKDHDRRRAEQEEQGENQGAVSPAAVQGFEAALEKAHQKVQAFQRALVLDAVAREVRKECAAARKASHSPGKFLAWLESFCPRQETALAAAIAWTLRTQTPEASAGADHQLAQEVAHAHAAELKEQLLTLAGQATADKLPAAVSRWERRWEFERPGVLTDRILSDKGGMP